MSIPRVHRHTSPTLVRLELRSRDEVKLVRALLGLHVRRSMNRPGMESASAVLARRLLRRLDG